MEYLVFALAYVYAFVGGFTDAANAIATSVGSRVYTFRTAVTVAAIFNLLGGLTGTAVAATIGKGIINPTDITLATIAAALAAAMTWSIATYFWGIPVSETHGIVGGLVGAGIATAGTGTVQWPGVFKVAAAIIVSPLAGFAAGILVTVLLSHLLQNAHRRYTTPIFGNLQRVSTAFMSFSHGLNDAQKPMGLVAMVLAVTSGRAFEVPMWVVVSCSATAAAGTALGGWRIVKTMGKKLTVLRPVHGFSAELASASVLQGASALGVPVSTTHAIGASIMGVGFAKRRKALRWGLATEILSSWLVTIPITATLGWLYSHAANAAVNAATR